MKAHEPNDITKAQVKALAAFLPQVAVARYMSMDVRTLRKHYTKEMSEASLNKDMQVVESLFKNAVQGNVSAQIFWCKTRLGMSETTATAQPDEEDTAVTEIEVVIAKPEEK